MQKSSGAKIAAVAAAVALLGGTAGWLALQPRDPITSALERVQAGEVHEGCPELEAALAAAGENEARPDTTKAESACVDHAIEGALAEEDLAERERALLALAAPHHTLQASSEQLSRIARETAELPGALEKGLGRIAPYRYQAQGPVKTKDMRSLVRGLDLPIRGCHAVAAKSDPALEGHFFLQLDVAADGSISHVRRDAAASTVQSDALTDCLVQLFTAQALPAKDRESTIGAELHIRPFAR